ncbi:DUF3489 domain-containing protein [Methylobacterium frigidaeris]|uniref:DUF3489 domain-containing protein n=1 Tax=Methylobacterium frigidaeris TaxID=2038277 RepID=A0AA37HJ26_9HYPH|nr:DUF3489 domain-containing protein [Methylobacterium frigidaeris]GJD66813.1 hypothetical protein MPEAHAMD_7012 [Methylobacterium frigidaeris]
MTRRPHSEALTDAHLTLLVRIAQQPHGLLWHPDHMAAGSFARTARRLLTRGLIEQAGEPHSGSGPGDAAEASMVLRITAAGLAAIGITPEPASTTQPTEVPSRYKRQRKRATSESPTKCPPAAAPHSDIQVATALIAQPAPRPGSKRAQLVALLSREQGASLADLMAMTGWLPHTTRAALTGLRQGGFTVCRSVAAEGSSIYRIVSSGPAPTEAA